MAAEAAGAFAAHVRKGLIGRRCFEVLRGRLCRGQAGEKNQREQQ
jgi:hypothetical protein